MLRRAFSLLEVIIVIGIISAMTALSIPAYRDYQIRSDLDKVAQQVSQGLARAQFLAKSGEQDAPWGFYVPAGILYQGESYATREEGQDQTYPMPSTIAVTGLLDVAFDEVTGTPTEVGNIVLRALNDDERVIQVTIAVDSQSIATNNGDVLTICHRPGQSDQQTLTVPDATWPTHMAHGDTMGACSGGGTSSAGATSSVSSAGASSSQSSAGGGGAPGGGSCSSKFTVAEDQTITMTAASSVTFTNMLSLLTFGSGGPQIPVHVCYSNDGGSSFSPLFGGGGNCSGNGNAYGNAVAPGGTDTATKSISNGAQLVVRMAGRYKIFGWLAFSERFDSNDESGHVLILKDGDSIADYPGFSDQEPLLTYLQSQGMANASGEITLDDCQLLAVGELLSLGIIGADYQDDIMLMSFH